jgi:hypothetical protein
MTRSVFRHLPALGAGLAIALLGAGAAASAESKVRVTNAAVNPVTFSLDGKSKDIRPRKAMTFTVDTMSPTYSLYFHNGVADRGEVDMLGTPTVMGADGLEYRCLTLRDDGFDFDLKDDCDKKINKPKK